MRPTYKRPYFYIHNVQTPGNSEVTSKAGTITIGRASSTQTSNSPTRMEIRCGNVGPFILKTVYVDYLRTPSVVRLTQE